MGVPFSGPEWERAGTDEPDTRHADGMASESPHRTGYRPPRALPGARTSSFPLEQEPPWVDPPFDAYFPTIMGNLAVLDSGDGNNLYGTITCRQLVAQSISGAVTGGVAPSGQTNGTVDPGAIAAAWASLAPPGGGGTGGLVQLGPGDFYVTAAAGQIAVAPPAQQIGSGQSGGGPVSVRGTGAATVLHVVGGCTGLYYHRASGYGAQFGNPAQKHVGFIKDLIIDGSAATAGAIGLDVGDGWGHDVDVSVVNFNQTQAYTATSASPAVFTWATGLPNGFPVQLQSGAPGGFTAGVTYYVINTSGAGAANGTSNLAAYPGGPALNSSSTGSGSATCTVPVRISNQVFWTEKGRFRISSSNNAIAAVLDTLVPSSDHSREYNDIDIIMFCQDGQNGVAIASGLNCNGRGLFIHGNMAAASNGAGNPGNLAALSLTGTDGVGDATRLYQTHFRMKVEGNNPHNYGAPVYPMGLYSDGNGYFKQVGGQIAHSLGVSQWNGAEFSFSGPVSGDTNLADLVPSTAGSQATLIDQAYTATSASPCVFTVSPGPAYPNGCPVQLSGGSPPTGFNNNTVYYVVSSSGSTFQLAATPGGAAINSSSTGNGTANVLGPPMPASGTIQQNYGPDQVVCVTGGTVSGISLAGENTGLISGAFPVPAGGSITINYSVAPTWTWLPAHQVTY